MVESNEAQAQLGQVVKGLKDADAKEDKQKLQAAMALKAML